MEVGYVTCYHPLKGFQRGILPSGKKDMLICEFAVDHIYQTADGKWNKWWSPDCAPGEMRRVSEYTEIPCGQCIGCRLEYSRQWANRLMMELEHYDPADCWFITLTYRDGDAPETYYGDPDTGIAIKALTLDKDDPTLWLKRLRKYMTDHDMVKYSWYDDAAEKNRDISIRYYLAGEYGPATFRPHYHACVFGLHLPPDDLFPWGKNKLGDQYYRSHIIEQTWGKGICVVAPMTWETAAYTARYVTKKLTGESAEFYDFFNLVPPYCVMSRRPGIGAFYYDEHGWEDSYTLPQGRVVHPPKYFADKYEVDNPDDYATMKESRKHMAEASKRLKLKHSSLNYLELLASEERCRLESIKALPRKDL